MTPANNADLRHIFNSAAQLYHRARPDYPAELYTALIRAAGLEPGDRLLEVGCATGKATLPLARRGYPITCLEPGPDLAAEARRNLAGFDAEVIETTFEDWQPRGGESFSLVYAATAWHWVDPAVRYRRARAALRPGELAESGADIESCGLFDVALIRHFDWEVRYDAEAYVDLLSTFSGHLAMAGWQRERLFSEIRRRLGLRPDRTLRRHWGAVLHVARAADGGRQPSLLTVIVTVRIAQIMSWKRLPADTRGVFLAEVLW